VVFDRHLLVIWLLGCLPRAVTLDVVMHEAYITCRFHVEKNFTITYHRNLQDSHAELMANFNKLDSVSLAPFERHLEYIQKC
jgi:hypothetical protein